MRKLLVLALTLGLVVGMASMASAVTVGYYENFQGYSESYWQTTLQYSNLWADRGDPINWGRIGSASGSPGYDSYFIDWSGTRYVQLEDDTAMFLQIDTTGWENVTISFNWATGSTTKADYAEFGVYVGDLSGYFSDGWTNSNLRGFFDTTALGRSCSWQSATFGLDSDTSSIWVFMGINDGEGDFAYFDNISICGTEIPSQVPIPAAVWLLGSGLVGLAGLRRKFS